MMIPLRQQKDKHFYLQTTCVLQLISTLCNLLHLCVCHNWLGCLLSMFNMEQQEDINYRLQNASRACQANRLILCDKNLPIALRFKFFDAMVTSVVCFAAGHRKLYVGELRKLDVHCRKLLRRMVGPPADVNWNGPWHEIFVSGTSA